MKFMLKTQPFEVKFGSVLIKSFIEHMPSFRGSSTIGSLLLRLIPFLNKEAYLKIGEILCRLDLKYKTHFAFLMKPFEPIESHLILSILKEGDVFFDIGSNWGYYTFLGSAAVGTQGIVVAIEANDKVFYRLLDMVRTAGLNNVLPFNLAMSNVIGDKVLIHQPWYKVDTGGFIRSIRKNSYKFTARTKTLDLLWLQLGCPRVKMVKIDTEGAEPLILEEGRRFFTEGLVGAALIEVGSWTKQRFKYEPIYIYRKMEEFGFSYAYGITDNKLRQIKMPMDESSVFFGNVLFGKADLSGLIVMSKDGA